MVLDCGIPFARLAAWLNDELRLARDGAGWVFVLRGSRCRIELAPLENRVLGTVSLERTLLSIEGDPEAQVEMQRLFTLRFASAGG